MKLPSEVADVLKFYGYVYIDPHTGEPFYIGRGTGDRILSHLGEQSDSEKVARIAEIRRRGSEPRIELLRYGLSDVEAALVEAAAIDLIGTGRLTNRVRGHHERSFGRTALEDLISVYTAKPTVVRHPAILITINQLYRSDMSALELYEATRGVWRVGPQRERAQYAMAIFRGVVREVYQISRWSPAGTHEYQTRDIAAYLTSGRWEFSGDVAREIRDEYVGFSVGKGSQNPIRYVNL